MCIIDKASDPLPVVSDNIDNRRLEISAPKLFRAPKAEVVGFHPCVSVGSSIAAVKVTMFSIGSFVLNTIASLFGGASRLEGGTLRGATKCPWSDSDDRQDGVEER